MSDPDEEWRSISDLGQPARLVLTGRCPCCDRWGFAHDPLNPRQGFVWLVGHMLEEHPREVATLRRVLAALDF